MTSVVMVPRPSSNIPSKQQAPFERHFGCPVGEPVFSDEGHGYVEILPAIPYQ